MTAVLLAALPLRLWGINAPFESSDQAAIAYLVQHSFGIKWIFAHDYGPVLPALQCAAARLATALDLGASERIYRGTALLIDIATLLATWPLLRRMGCTGRQALTGMIAVALLPAMVSNAHFAWNHMGAWLLTGVVALWATLAWLDDRRPWQLVTAGIALFAHCLSSAIALALPLTLAWAWLQAWRQARHQERRYGHAMVRAAAAAYVLPCVAASGVIVASWRWTGRGQLGHLLAKFESESGGWHWNQFLHLPAMWTAHFGYVYGVVAAAGLLWATLRLVNSYPYHPALKKWATWGNDGGERPIPSADRLGLLALWAWCGLLPMVMFADWGEIGHAGAYLIEPVYAAGVLGGLLLAGVHARLKSEAVHGSRMNVAAFTVVMIAAFAHLGLGAVDACLAGGRWHAMTGTSAAWGSYRPDSGIKAAGWYLRKHVPPEAVIMVLHTNAGMEIPVAEFYLGRKVLAGYDHSPALSAELFSALRARIDVLVIEANALPDEALSDFERICTIRRDGRPVRLIYGRRGCNWPRVDENVAKLNRWYDGLGVHNQTPMPLSCSPRQAKILGIYQAMVRDLKARESSHADRLPTPPSTP